MEACVNTCGHNYQAKGSAAAHASTVEICLSCQTDQVDATQSFTQVSVVGSKYGLVLYGLVLESQMFSRSVCFKQRVHDMLADHV